MNPYEAEKYGDQIEELKGMFEMQQREIEAMKDQQQRLTQVRASKQSSISDGERIQDVYTNELKSNQDYKQTQERWTSRGGELVQNSS